LLSHLRSCERYDEPETFPYSIHPVCPMSADGGQRELVACLLAHAPPSKELEPPANPERFTLL
jgi:hypothetical protein